MFLTMPTPYEKEMERLHKLVAEVETDEDPDFDSEDNGPEHVSEEIFQFMKVSASMIRIGSGWHYGNEDLNNLELFS
ncbi:hypothetical protein AVEN_24253-1 [Araneus ventricosus]|uniref:Uncharacterized protein n=1 Tax=Araneus ventricosus TaxID=182803 RepID=A0A4Y2WN71_ARAVE|nr:hypothetical protein AVEN_197075-1 [Araneus ventricosus]GBO38599.1 hypothetical protein AVEN_24253-1 [Araneus ventricosus]